ncbi:LRR domain containing protein, partial [Trema orientale]
KRITILGLSGNNFVGELPKYYGNSSEISSLENSSRSQSVEYAAFSLNFLDLSDNRLNGTLPSWLYVIPSLAYLDLSGNQFTGIINEFQTRSLQFFYLNDNQLEGMIPRSLYQQSNLFWLDLSSNNLTGVVELNHFEKLKNLNYLSLSFNYNLSFSSTNSVNYTLPMLSDLHLSSCNISQFPLFLKALKNLELLDLSSNHIQGKVPVWLGNVGTDTLTYLDLSNNFLTNVEQVPWRNLWYLDFSSNRLQGHLPVPPPSTYMFLISNNQISGELPSSICNLEHALVLDLSANSLTGKIPPCIGNISVDTLDLRLNRFHGEIPSTFAKGNVLRNLNLYGNQLEGSLPQSLINCKALEILDVGNNKINGIFPHWLQSLPLLQVLILRSNKFHDSISDPQASSAFQKLRILDISDNEFTGLLPKKYFENMMAMVESYRSCFEIHGGRSNYKKLLLP